MNFDIESKSTGKKFWVGRPGGEGWVRGGRGMRVQGRVQLSCGHVDNDRKIIHEDNPSQGYFLEGGGEMRTR